MRQQLCSHRVSLAARMSPCCSGASATACRTRRWRSRIGLSLFRSIRLSPSATTTLPQAVAVAAPEWLTLASGGVLPFAMPQKSPPAGKEQVQAFFANLERQLDQIEYFRPLEKRATMLVNLRNIFARMQPTQQDIQTLHGIVVALSEGRKGPARGGVLDGEEAAALRALIAEHGHAAGETGPARGLARLLRRNPTDAERALWHALTNDRRFADKGIKRQVPVGPHIVDFVSLPLRLVIELLPED